MRLDEALLRALSKSPEQKRVSHDPEPTRLDGQLWRLRREYSDFSSMVQGRKVADFGCGMGLQSAAMVKEEGCYVHGIDTNLRTLEKAKKISADVGIQEDKLTFVERPTPDIVGTFDVVISQNSMEHFEDPTAVVNTMKSLIHDNGKILITFGPPWLAPYGAHMYFFCKIPWINLLFSERAIMNVRADYRDDGARRYEDVESGLNRMTLRKFENTVSSSGLTIAYKNYSCIKGQDWLAKIPLLRELFVNHVTCILTVAK